MSFEPPIAVDVLLLLAYAALTMLVALGLEGYGALMHRNLRRSKTAGFDWAPKAQAWRCTEGGYLWFQGVRPESRMAIYQADAGRCNRCPIKSSCTGSDEGRVLEESLEEWADSHMSRFHRAFSLTLVAVGAAFCAAGLIYRSHEPLETALLATMCAACLAAGAWLVKRIAARPAPQASHTALHVMRQGR